MLNSLNDLATQSVVVAHFANQTQQLTGTEVLQEINKVAEILQTQMLTQLHFNLIILPLGWCSMLRQMLLIK